MKKFILYSLLGICYSSQPILTIGEEAFFSQDFFSIFPKKQWNLSDSLQKESLFSDFVMRNLFVFEAKQLGFLSDPSIQKKIKQQRNNLLVNESYERLVAEPLIEESVLKEAHLYLKKDVFLHHILVGHSGSFLQSPPKRDSSDAYLLALEIKNRLSLGEPFGSLAQQFSNDPSVEKNNGILGWVSWGQTVPAFQSAAFSLDIGLVSDPVSTDFGYHIIFIEKERPSEFSFYGEEEYRDAVINVSKGTIRPLLRDAAIIYDSLQIKNAGVVFNKRIIKKISQKYNLDMSTSGSIKNKTVSSLLGDILDRGIVCVYNGEGLGLAWFQNKMQSIPASRHPDLSTENNIISVFKTIILQDIAIQKAYENRLEKSFSFLKRKKSLINGILYDAYLKFLINNASPLDSTDIVSFYNKNKKKYTYADSVKIREIRVENSFLADSLYGLLLSGESFSDIQKTYSLKNRSLRVFSKKQNAVFYDAAMSLELEEISPIIPHGKYYSIIMLNEKIVGRLVSLSSIYSKVKAAALKEQQKNRRASVLKNIKKKYIIKTFFENII